MAVSTERFAAARMVKPQSVISRLSKTGSYFGVRPVKLENGRLAWPDDAAERQARSTPQQESTAAAA